MTQESSTVGSQTNRVRITYIDFGFRERLAGLWYIELGLKERVVYQSLDLRRASGPLEIKLVLTTG